MTRRKTTNTVQFTVIDGGANSAGAPIFDLPLPIAPQFCAAELAAQMAEMFAMGLVSGCRPEDLSNPHCSVRIDRATRFNLHELLCEFRSLPWCDSNELVNARWPCAAPSEANLADAQQRRAGLWNNAGEMTLATLFQSGIHRDLGGLRLSELFSTDVKVADPDGPVAPPPARAPLSQWVRWCAQHSGAGLAMPGQTAPKSKPHTLTALASRVCTTPAARPFHSAALAALANGTALDAGLDANGMGANGWTGARVFSLIAQAEIYARRAAIRWLTEADRLSRPAVTAARMTVYLAREERHISSGDARHREAADQLLQFAPNLLSWVSKANAAARGAQRFEHSLFLPLGTPAAAYHPSDAAAHVIVAGTLSTVMKAVFDTSRPSHLHLADSSASRLDLARELDLLASNYAMARVVSGGYLPAENHQDLRLGQSIGLQILRSALEQDNRSASVRLRGFDGDDLKVVCNPRSFGRGHAELHRDEQAVHWPQDCAKPSAHLTAVV